MSTDLAASRSEPGMFWWTALVVVGLLTAIYLFAAISDWIPHAFQTQDAVIVDWDSVGLANGIAWSIYNYSMWLMTGLVLSNVLATVICWRAAHGRPIAVLSAVYVSAFVGIAGTLSFMDWRGSRGEDRFGVIFMTAVLALPLWLFIARGISRLAFGRFLM